MCAHIPAAEHVSNDVSIFPWESELAVVPVELYAWQNNEKVIYIATSYI